MQEIATVFWQILPILIAIAVPSLLVLTKWLSSKIGKKLDTEQQAKIQELLTGVVLQGVAYAEQMAKQKQKENQQLTGESKLYIATQYVVEELRKNNFADLTAVEIQKRIEAILGMEALTANAASNALFRPEGGPNEDGSVGFSN